MNDQRNTQRQQTQQQNDGAKGDAPKRNTEIVKSPQEMLSQLPGTFRNAAVVNQRMAWAMEHCHLISPATSVGAMPEGLGISLSIVQVDVEKDTYSTGDKRGLSKHVLQQLSAALGIKWDATLSGRVDDASDPRYVRWRAVGKYRSFDGQIQDIVCEKQLDLRDGSPICLKLNEEGKKRYDENVAKGWKNPGHPDGRNQIREMRAFIQEHAETKAQLRAIRSLGIKTGYKPDELKKPFVAARVMFTGQTDDPELRKMFAEKTADAFLGASTQMYPQLSGGTPQGPARSAPPPVGSVIDEDDDEFGAPDAGGGRGGDGGGEPPRPEQRQAQRPAFNGEYCGVKMPGRAPKGGIPIEEAEDRDIEYWIKTLDENLRTNKSKPQFRQKDEDTLNALRAEQKRRVAQEAASQRPNDDDDDDFDDGGEGDCSGGDDDDDGDGDNRQGGLNY